jgi:hypothetical protein
MASKKELWDMGNSMNRLITLMFISCLFVARPAISAEEYDVRRSLNSTSTCDLPRDAEITYGIPILENINFHLGLLEHQNGFEVLLIEFDKSAAKCPNEKNIDMGKILSSLPVNSKIVDGLEFINLECKKNGTKHHFIGVVAQRRFTKRYVHPKHAWEVDLGTHSFNEVEPSHVECFVGGYD